VAFIARSGYGKSTLFKALTGLIKPMDGQILITNLSTEDEEDAKPWGGKVTWGLVPKYTLLDTKH
jgi:polar amino acid transport system ATP-binding protein